MENKYNPIPLASSFFLSWKYPSFLHCKHGDASDLKQWLGWVYSLNQGSWGLTEASRTDWASRFQGPGDGSIKPANQSGSQTSH